MQKCTYDLIVFDPRCGSFHIGKTRRNLAKRLEEHQSSPNSEVCNHLQYNSTHKVDFHNPQILTSCLDKHKLLILESLYIQLLNPSPNFDSSSYPLRLLMRERHRPIFSFHFNQHHDIIHVSLLLCVENGTRRGPKRSQ